MQKVIKENRYMYVIQLFIRRTATVSWGLTFAPFYCIFVYCVNQALLTDLN